MTVSELHPGDHVIVRHAPGEKPPRVAKVLLVLDGIATVRIVVGMGRYASRATRLPVSGVVRPATDRERVLGMPIGALPH
jgi:hypothetical protein